MKHLTKGAKFKLFAKRSKVLKCAVGFSQIARQCKRAQAKKCFFVIKTEPIN